MQQIKVCIDPEIVNGGQLPEESLLLQKLESFGARHKVESQLIPASITWKRAVVEHDVADTLQVKLIKHTLVSSSTNYHKFSFFSSTIKEWNNLPQNMVELSSLASFKAQLAKHFRNRQIYKFYGTLKCFYGNPDDLEESSLYI